jgi:hypothetical protein
MGLRTYDYECDCGVTEVTIPYEDRDSWSCSECGRADRLMCAPAVHTLETRMRGFKSDNSADKHTGQGYWNPGFGEFIDENLTDPNTGEPARYSSLKEREKLMEKYGKFDLNDINRGKATTFNGKKKRVIFTKEGNKGTASKVH